MLSPSEMLTQALSRCQTAEKGASSAKDPRAPRGWGAEPSSELRLQTTGGMLAVRMKEAAAGRRKQVDRSKKYTGDRVNRAVH